MSPVMKMFMALGMGYLFGSIPSGFLIGKINRIDLRKCGSGNIGATNVRRILGKKWAILCFVLDFLKGLVPVLIIANVLSGENGQEALFPVLAAGAAVAGHVWPFTLKFKGGKGVATTIGALLALAPWSVLIALITWIGIFYLVRYVSLASILAAVMLPLTAAVERILRGNEPPVSIMVLLVLLAVVILVRHKSNIKRLLAGEEYRFERKQTE